MKRYLILVDEIEWTLSRNSDIITYNAAPLIRSQRTIGRKETKGQKRKAYLGCFQENGKVVRYVSWEGNLLMLLSIQIESLDALFLIAVA